ncbi:hypothetical protein [Pseudomonas fluorescens]|uniref:hypothetical protein n=1 Tax=Pseudomonas fluorescens TaxID=294 RepID=UPI001BED1991|nr:hypothetical protein [Pseudomonas fluorescens]MBT2374598.1 hypothetical protein [Pseudomonas fluorescens]
MSWEVIFGWIESHPGLASWIQAVGSIAAIFAAILIAGRDSRIRRRSDSEARSGAIERAIIVVNDSAMRLSGAIHTVENLGIRRPVLALISSDLAQSQRHLKEILSIQGVDSVIYTQIFVVRTAIETAVHTFDVLGGLKNEEEFDLEIPKGSLDQVVSALDNLSALRTKF